ncbi:response regulator [Synechococcus sp. PCC 7336]|uniref:response regulator n=1 Tax=Synechococcus sp. PCC 7336 TaxID=195250 RepID=UPI00034D6CBA|nr:response regulator [Synechococcus sp. PCC 7336]
MPKYATTILVIHSSKQQKWLWKTALASQGVSTIVETTEGDMLDLLGRVSPDAVLLDISSGQFNPYEVSRKCRDRFPTLPIVLTNHAERPIAEVERRWAIQQGASDLIADPTSLSELCSALQRVLELSTSSISLDRTALEAVLPKRKSAKATSDRPQSFEEKAPETVPPTSETKPISAAVAKTPPKPRLMYRGRPIG